MKELSSCRLSVQHKAGLVQSSDGEDAIVADENNGTMKVASLNVSKLIENDDVIFILDGGNSAE